MPGPTLIKPPPPSKDRAPIEDVLELTSLNDVSPNLFTNTRQLWHPPGARGIYGGAVIAQCLAAAHKTVPHDFTVHSMHCYFVLNGNSDIPIIYHVEHVREGRSFATRTVQARQRGQPVFTTTISFMKAPPPGTQTIAHQAQMPDIQPPPEGDPIDIIRGGKSPFLSQHFSIQNNDSPHPHLKRTRQWIKARGKISEEGGYQAHLSALAYMSDSYFIGTVSRVHKLYRYSHLLQMKDPKTGEPLITPEFVQALQGMSTEDLKRIEGMDEEVIGQLKTLVVKNGQIVSTAAEANREIGMMVSLDHSIYFHNPRDFRADEWMFVEAQSPWAGEDRGLVMQHIFTKDGKLIATCTQEGLVRLKQTPAPSKL